MTEQEIPRSREVFEVRIVCDNPNHSRCGERPTHVTAFTYREGGFADGGWLVARRELRKPGYARVESPVSSRTSPTTPAIEKVTGWKETGGPRYEPECPRCGFRVVARDSSMVYVLNKLKEVGVTQISLRRILSALDSEALLREVAEKMQGTTRRDTTPL